MKIHDIIIIFLLSVLAALTLLYFTVSVWAEKTSSQISAQDDSRQEIIFNPISDISPATIIDPWTIVPKEGKMNPLLEQKGVLRNPGRYQEGECEKAAKDWQIEYGGELVFIAPMDLSGAWVLGDYAGAWINHKNGVYYDYFTQSVYSSKDDIAFYYAPALSQRLGKKVNVSIFIIGYDPLPYPMVYHY